MKRPVFLAPFFLLFPLAAHAQGTVTFGGGASTQGDANANANATAPAEAAPAQGEDADWEERDRQMNEASTLTGGVGLLHTQHAEGGAAGQFRVGFTTAYFSGGFLCTSD